TPLNALGFTLVALVCILLGPFNRRGQNSKIMIAVILVVALQALNMAAVSAAKKQPDMLFILYITTFLPLIAGFFLLHTRGEQWLLQASRRWRHKRYLKTAGGTT